MVVLTLKCFFEVAKKVVKYLGYLCKKIRSEETYKNRPIWSHCFGVTLSTTLTIPWDSWLRTKDQIIVKQSVN